MLITFCYTEWLNYANCNMFVTIGNLKKKKFLRVAPAQARPADLQPPPPLCVYLHPFRINELYDFGVREYVVTAFQDTYF